MPNNEQVELVELPPERLREAAELVADALADNPVFAAVCGDAGDGPFRRRFLSFVFERNLRLRCGTGVNRAVFDDGADGGRLVASFMFVAPGAPGVGILDMLRAGMLRAPLLFGPGAFARLLSAKAEYERVERAVVAESGGGPFYRLERMAVRSDRRGRGIGSAALGRALEEADGAGRPVLLSTQEERNVRFYGRLGFEVAREDEIMGCRSWSMVRRPGGGVNDVDRD